MRAVIFLIGCTAITDFSQFGSGDLAVKSGDLAYVPATFGQLCDPSQPMPCVLGQSAPMRPLMCFTSLDGHPVTGGICTRECLAGAVACSDYGSGATCAPIGTITQPNYCVPLCVLPNEPCRAGLVCCSGNMMVTSGSGTCLPSCTHD